MSHRSFLFALLASIALHGVLLGAGELARMLRPAGADRPASARLDAHLVPARASVAVEPLLKDTLAEEATVPAIAAPAAAPGVARGAGRKTSPSTSRAMRRAAERKLAAQVFYPPEAVAQGLEGEVRVLLRLAPDGTIRDASIASGSGHALLDAAALRAARAMGRVPDAGVAELILPVVFRLQ